MRIGDRVVFAQLKRLLTIANGQKRFKGIAGVHLIGDGIGRAVADRRGVVVVEILNRVLDGRRSVDRAVASAHNAVVIGLGAVDRPLDRRRGLVHRCLRLINRQRGLHAPKKREDARHQGRCHRRAAQEIIGALGVVVSRVDAHARRGDVFELVIVRPFDIAAVPVERRHGNARVEIGRIRRIGERIAQLITIAASRHGDDVVIAGGLVNERLEQLVVLTEPVAAEAHVDHVEPLDLALGHETEQVLVRLGERRGPATGIARVVEDLNGKHARIVRSARDALGIVRLRGNDAGNVRSVPVNVAVRVVGARDGSALRVVAGIPHVVGVEVGRKVLMVHVGARVENGHGDRALGTRDVPCVKDVRAVARGILQIVLARQALVIGRRRERLDGRLLRRPFRRPRGQGLIAGHAVNQLIGIVLLRIAYVRQAGNRLDCLVNRAIGGNFRLQHRTDFAILDDDLARFDARRTQRLDRVGREALDAQARARGLRLVKNDENLATALPRGDFICKSSCLRWENREQAHREHCRYRKAHNALGALRQR